jgi:hypothetical protein
VSKRFKSRCGAGAHREAYQKNVPHESKGVTPTLSSAHGSYVLSRLTTNTLHAHEGPDSLGLAHGAVAEADNFHCVFASGRHLGCKFALIEPEIHVCGSEPRWRVWVSGQGVANWTLAESRNALGRLPLGLSAAVDSLPGCWVQTPGLHTASESAKSQVATNLASLK